MHAHVFVVCAVTWIDVAGVYGE